MEKEKTIDEEKRIEPLEWSWGPGNWSKWKCETKIIKEKKIEKMQIPEQEKMKEC